VALAAGIQALTTLDDTPTPTVDVFVNAGETPLVPIPLFVDEGDLLSAYLVPGDPVILTPNLRIDIGPYQRVFSSGYSGSGMNTLIANVALPLAGIYTLRTSEYTAFDGFREPPPVSVSVQAVVTDAALTFTTEDGVSQGPVTLQDLAPGTPANGTLETPLSVDVWTLTLPESDSPQTVTVTIEGAGALRAGVFVPFSNFTSEYLGEATTDTPLSVATEFRAFRIHVIAEGMNTGDYTLTATVE
jgi:hypothetical protein